MAITKNMSSEDWACTLSTKATQYESYESKIDEHLLAKIHQWSSLSL